MKPIVSNFFNRKISVGISDAATVAINNFAESVYPLETGGILLGWWDEGVVVISDALEVKDDDATGNSWTRHQSTAQSALDIAIDTAKNENLGYIGDWHCHPAEVGASSTDLTSLSRASRQYDKPIVLIVRLPGNKLKFYSADRGTIRAVRIV